MKVFDKLSFETAQFMAKGAVKIGSKNGGEFDWLCAMESMKTALGYYCSVESYEKRIALREQWDERVQG